MAPDDECTVRYRGGIGVAEPGLWMIVLQLWIEPQMTAHDAIAYESPQRFKSQAEALEYYETKIRPAIVEPMLARARKDGMTIEKFVASAREIEQALAERGDTPNN